MLFSKRLKRWRGRTYLKEAAASLGVCLSTYRKYESGTRTPEKVEQARLESILEKVAPSQLSVPRTIGESDLVMALKKWRGARRQKEAAEDLDVELATYRSWEHGIRQPTESTRLEIERRMAAKPDTTK